MKRLFVALVILVLTAPMAKAESAQEFHDKGEAAYKVKNYAKAVEYYTEALKIEPERHESRYARGVNYFSLKRYDDALADFNKIKNVRKIDHHALNYIGLIYNAKEDSNAALKAFGDAAKLNPQNVLYNLNAARTAVQIGSRASALAYYKQALKIDPTNKEADKYIEAHKAAEEGRRVATEQRESRTPAQPTYGPWHMVTNDYDFKQIKNQLRLKVAKLNEREGPLWRGKWTGVLTSCACSSDRRMTIVHADAVLSFSVDDEVHNMFVYADNYCGGCLQRPSIEELKWKEEDK